MDTVVDFLSRAANSTGFERTTYTEKKMPTNFQNLLVVPFFGDIKSTFILSSLLLKRIKETRPNKYLILCSWPGYETLFPYVDEFWRPKDMGSLKEMALAAGSFSNTSDVSANYTRSLIQRFDDVLTNDKLREYYNSGFQKAYLEDFKDIKRFFPTIASSSRINDTLKQGLTQRSGHKVVVFPTLKARSWQRGRTEYCSVNKEFWVALVDRLISEGITPVVYQNQFSHDISRDFADKCLYLVSNSLEEVLASFRYIGCVLDVYSGISRFATAARCPYVCVDERMRYISDKEYEIDDICSVTIPRQYIFSLSGVMLSGDVSDWNSSVFDNIVARLNSFLPSLNRDTWDSTSESEVIVSYDTIRKLQSKRLGMRFIRKY